MREELNIIKDFPPTPHAEWMAAVEQQLKGKPFEKALVKKTYEGLPIQPMYFKKDLEGLPQVDAMPGFAPYIRGTLAIGSRAESWKIAQEITEPEPEAFNKALTRDLDRGQNAINIRLDQTAMAGKDPQSTDPDKVGAGGVSLSTTADVAAMFKGIALGDYPIQMETGMSAVAAAALLAAHLKNSGQPVNALTGCIAADPIQTLAIEGRLPISLDAAYDQMAGLTRWTLANAPGLQTIAVHGDCYRNAGGNAVQEIAFIAATGAAYIQAMLDRGLAIDDICQHIRFHLAIGSDFFMEIAKFRAARMIWHNIAEAFGAGEETRKMKIHASTLKYNKTLIDPWVNMLRVTTEAFSGIAGGCDSIHVGPFDEVIRRPDEFSRRIARNVQVLLKEEAHFDKVIDPAGGSWYVENITLALAQKSWSLFQEIEGKGGMAAALVDGFPREQIEEIAQQRAKNAATRKDRIVGTNMYPNLLEKPLQTRDIDHAALQQRRIDQVAAFQKASDATLREAVLGELASTAVPDADLLDKAIAAARAGASLGELTAAIQKPGEAVSVTPLRIHRGAESYEKLRRATEATIAETGAAPKIFMANLGPLARHKPRSDFATAFFTVAAFETVFTDGFATPDEAADAALASGQRAVVICGTDDDYMDAVPPLTKKLKAADPEMMVIVAGYSPKYVDLFKEAGVDAFIHLRANALAILTALQDHLIQPKGVNK
jgi:methylmalonyl-CoA mutase